MTFYNHIENARYRCIERFNCQGQRGANDKAYVSENLDQARHEYDQLKAENDKLRKLCADLRFCKRSNCLTCSHGRFCDMRFDERYEELGIEVNEC